MQKERKKRKKHDRKLPIATTWERIEGHFVSFRKIIRFFLKNQLKT